MKTFCSYSALFNFQFNVRVCLLQEVLISSSDDESPDHAHVHDDVDVIAISSDEMYSDNGGLHGNLDEHDIQATGEAYGTAVNNDEAQLTGTTSGSRVTSSSQFITNNGEPATRKAELHYTTVHTQQCSSKFQPDVDHMRLQEVFCDKLCVEQIASMCKVSGEDFAASMECLLSGPTLQSILLMMNQCQAEQPVIKVDIDHAEAWEDTVAFYKSSRLDFAKQIRVRFNDQPAIDVGGVRAQLYSTVFDVFSQNRKITLFDGNVRRLRPHCSAEARSSGLFKVLGKMVGHSIMQDGIGFPYLAPMCYWYLAGREQKALESLSVEDLNEDVGFLVTKVIVYYYVFDMCFQSLTCV